MPRAAQLIRRIVAAPTIAMLVFAQCGGDTGTDTSALVSVTLPESSLQIGLGATLTLTAQARNARQELIPGITTFSWLSSDASIATVDASGHVHGVALGTATITVSKSGKSATASVAVTPATVTVSTTATSLNAGQTAQLSAAAADAAGNPIPGVTVNWSVTTIGGDPVIATISPSGLVTAVAPGLVTVNATIAGKTGTKALGVTGPYDGSWSGGDAGSRSIVIQVQFGVIKEFSIPSITTLNAGCAPRHIDAFPDAAPITDGHFSFGLPVNSGGTINVTGQMIHGTFTSLTTMTGDYPSISLPAEQCLDGTTLGSGLAAQTFTTTKG